ILDFGLSRHLAEAIARPGTLAADASAAAGLQDRTPLPSVPASPPAAEAQRHIHEGLTSSYSALGTVDYIAPEEAMDARRADIRADIYSLGCTLYRFLSGQVPFPGGDCADKIHRHLTEAPAPLAGLRPDLPPALISVVERMMSKDFNARYKTPQS